MILVTAQHDLDARFRGTRVGADDFLFLPINRLELIARVKSLLRLRMYFKDLEEHQSVILSLASALEAKDPYTRGHSERVGVLAAQLGRALGLSEADCDLLRIAGQLHDIGKIGMPETPAQQAGPARRRGVQDGHAAPPPRASASAGRCAPCRPCSRSSATTTSASTAAATRTACVGEAIPIGARILGLADAYDALTSARSYRRSFTPAQALELLDQGDRRRPLGPGGLRGPRRAGGELVDPLPFPWKMGRDRDRTGSSESPC